MNQLPFKKSRRSRSIPSFTKQRKFSHERLEPRMMMTINPSGSDFLVNDTVPGFQSIDENVSSVAVSDAFGTVSAYAGVGAGTREGIFLRRFNQAGTAEGAAVRVNSTIQGSRTAAAVAANEAGNTVVVWQGRGPSDKHGIFMRLFDANGDATSGELLVNETIGGLQHDPSVAMADDGSFVVSWSGPGGADSAGVFARRFNTDGTGASGEELVNTITAGEQSESAVSVNSSGDYVITWSSRDQDGDDWGVFGQRFNAAGERQGDEFGLNTTTATSQRESSVALQDDGTWMAVWSSLGQDGDSWAVVGQRFDATGAAVGNEFVVNSTTSGHQRHPQIAGANGKYLVSWQSGVANGSGWEVMAQEFDADGNPVGSEQTVNSGLSGPNSGHQQHPAVALNAVGNGAVVWSGEGTSDRQGVFGRRFQDDEPAEDNLTPDLEPIDDQTVVPNTQMEVTVTASDQNAGDTLTYQLDPNNSPAGATIEKTDNNTAIIRWTPTDTEQNTVVKFRVIVTDDGNPPLADVEEFEVTVTDGMVLVDLNGSDEPGADTEVNFLIGGGAVSIVDDDLLVVGADSGTISSATAQLSIIRNAGEEFLEVDTLDTNITTSFNANNRTLTLTGEDTQENYQRVLRTLTYNNTASNPRLTRDVRVRVNDGTEESEIAIASITIGTADLVGFAQALAASDTMFFGAAWCPDCTAQKELFEDGGQFLPFTEVTNPDRTLNQTGTDNNISVFPTWVFSDGTRLEGVQSLETLAERSGVAIPVSDDPFIAPIANDTLLIGSPLHIPLDGYDPNGGTLTYSVSTDNSAVSAEILTGNRSARVNVAGYGDMVFELFEQRASRPTDRFIELANDDFYDDIIFHRVINNFVIQGGDPQGTGTGGSNLGDFDDQFHVDLQHNRTGLLSYAKSSDDTNDSQFFVTEGDSSSLRNLDFNHSIFGILVEGESNRAAISDTEVIRRASDFQTPTMDRRIDRPGSRTTEEEFNITMENVDIFQDTENAVLILKADPGTTGDVTVTVTVSDEQGNTFERQFTVAVQEDSFNGRPFLGDIAPVSIAANTAAQVQLTATDVEGDDFVFTAVQRGSVNYTFNVNESGLLTVTPPTDFVGTMEIEVRVGRTAGSTDFDSQLISIEVT